MIGRFCDNSGDESELFQTTQVTNDSSHKSKIEIT